jgi:glycosyltransferase involved in cell wall biosynthesis
MGEMSPRISVVTPAYERADTLPRLYESLLAQTFAEFEWVVVDDGSSDGTGELVRGWEADSPFPIRYTWQQNQGKHAAVNRSVEEARGEFCAVMDSDDWYAPAALERMLHFWELIPAAEREGFANVEGLCGDPEGAVIGDRFPADVFDSNSFEISGVHGVHGDKIGMYRREILLANPFPEDLGWHVSPALIWNRIAARYSSRFVNEIWAYKEYLDSGLSGRETELRLRYAEAQLAYWHEYVAMPRRMHPKARLKANANYVRYSLLMGRGLGQVMAESPKRAWTLLALAPGLVLYRRDRPEARRLAAEAPK